MLFFSLENGCHFVESWSIRPKFSTAQRFEHTSWIKWQRRLRLQMYEKYIGPTLHMGPNNNMVIWHETNKIIHLFTLLILWIFICNSVLRFDVGIYFKNLSTVFFAAGTAYSSVKWFLLLLVYISLFHHK